MATSEQSPIDWGGGREMSAFEAIMWRSEVDPVLRSHMTGVEVLDCAPDWERLVDAHEWGSRMVPRLRQKVVEPLFGLGPPVWVVDDEFDLSYHLTRVVLPAPGSMHQLLELAQTRAMAQLDRSRPQWEGMLVEGLEGGRAAYVLKLNHALADGIGTIQLLSLMHSRRREPTTDKPQPPPPGAEAVPPPAGLLAEQLGTRLAGMPGDAARAAGAALGAAAGGLRRPERALGGAVRYVRSLERVLGPPPVEGSPLLRGRSRAWRFATHTVPLADLRAASKAADGSLNDAFLAALLGAFRRYHEHFGVSIERMPIAIPISLRTGDDPMGGNRFAGARFAAPVGEPDPRRRIRLLREIVISARDEPALDVLTTLAPALSRVPAIMLTRITRSASQTNDLQATNVPGINHPVYMAGAEVTELYGFGPLPGCAAMISLLSHNGTCCIAANVDHAAVTDPELFEACLREGFAEVLALAS